MKKQTLELFNKYLDKFTFTEVKEGLSVDYTLSDEEITELVESEYGQTTQDVNLLFEVMLKKLVKMAVEKHG